MEIFTREIILTVTLFLKTENFIDLLISMNYIGLA